jgi:hypothetical protein
MRSSVLIRRALATAVALALGLAACVDRPPPVNNFGKEDIQGRYDRGEIDYYTYVSMMRSLDPRWNPPAANAGIGAGNISTSGNGTAKYADPTATKRNDNPFGWSSGANM